MTGQATMQLGAFAAGASPPAAQLEAAAESLGAALERARLRSGSAPVTAALAAATAYGSAPGAGLIGRPERLDPAWAAFVNGVAGEDPVVAAALALGDQRGLPVGTVLAAIAIGLEAGIRLESALATAPGRRQWGPGAAARAIGAVATSGRLIGLDGLRLVVAIALATTQAGGIGGEDDGLGAGRAAFNAVEAALLAEAGFSAPATALEGRRGLVALTAPGADLEPLLEGLGEVWRLPGGNRPPLEGAGWGRPVAELLGSATTI